MGYLDLASFEELEKKRKSTPVVLSADSFSYKTDRTLTIGKNFSGAVLHVFIKDRVLHAHEYFEAPGKFADTDYITTSFRKGSLSVSELNPKFYAIPKATDQEFAELMLRFSDPLSFTKWDSSENNPIENISGYYGNIFQSA